MKKYILPSLLLIFAVVLFGGASSVYAVAETCTWQANEASSTHILSDQANWAGCTLDSADSLVFDGTTTTDATWDAGLTEVANVTINSGYTGTITIGAAAATTTGNLEMNAGTVTSTDDNAFNVGGNFTLGAGTLAGSTGTMYLYGTGKTLGGTTTATLPKLYITGSYTLAGNIDVNNVLTISAGGTLDAATYSIVLSKASGTPFVPTGTFTANAGTVTYSGTSANVASATYYNLTVNTAGTLAESATSTNDLTINAGKSLDLATYNFVDNGNFANSGTVTHTSGTVTLSGASKTLGGSGDTTLATVVIDGSIALAGNVTSTNTLTINATKSLDLSSYTVQLTKDSGTPFVATGTFTPNTGTISYSGGTSANVASASYYNLTVNTAGTLAGNVTSTNVLTISAGKSLDAATYVIGLTKATGSPLVVTGTFTPNASTVEYSGGTSANVTSATYYNLTVNTAGTLAGNVTSTNLLTINSGKSLAASSYTIELTKASGTPFVPTGTFTGGTGNVLYSGTSGNIASATYYNLTINNTGTLAGNVTSSGVLTINLAKSLDAGGKVIALSGTGTPLVITGTFTYATSTVSYSGATHNVASGTYYDLTIDGVGTLAGNVTSTDVLTINSGKSLDAGGKVIALTKASGTPFVPTGTFTYATSTVGYYGATSANIASASYYVLTVGTAGTLLGNVTSTNTFTNNGTTTIGSSYYLYAPVTFDNNGVVTETGAIRHPVTSSKLTNSSGSEISSFTASLDNVYVNVVDSDGNLNVLSADTITGSVVTASGYSDSETITLTETGADTSIFRSSAFAILVRSGATNNSGAFEVSGPGTFTLAFTDSKESADTGSDTASFAASTYSPGGGGGGGGGSSAPASPIAPTGGFKVTIGSSETTATKNITLTLVGGTDTVRMSISNRSDFSDAIQETYATTKSWTLTDGDGVKTVYAKFYTSQGGVSSAVSDTITLGSSQTTQPVTTPAATPETTPSVTPPVSSSGGVSGQIISGLTVGSENDQVTLLQQFLSQYADIYPEGRVTGYFGSLTKKAVQRFQEKYEIAVLGDAGYGYVGPKTRAKINELLSGVSPEVPAAPAAPAAPSGGLSQEQRALIESQIQSLQAALVQLLAQLSAQLQSQVGQ